MFCQMTNVWVGLVSQWKEEQTWLVLFVALACATAATIYLHKRRQWPVLTTALSLGWASLFVAMTWRMGKAPLTGDAGSGLISLGTQLFSSEAWAAAGDYLMRGDPFIVANLAVLLPFGLFCTVASRRLWVAILSAAVLVVLVESLQSLVFGGALHDILANLLGATIGSLIGYGYNYYRNRAARVRRHVSG